MPEGSCFHSEDSAGPTLDRVGTPQQLALDFYTRCGPIRCEGELQVELGPCPFEVEPFPWSVPPRRTSLLLASVRLFRLAHPVRSSSPSRLI